ncbi:signal recognition particle-docking protein FtsY [Afifella sp. JA880]|uniref:signal recognition particle-docking protein FtsY n=1 Tax=Afifella sp. JA880 TaxID=2975280 RepID=UPI0021BAF82F|nr:signal recognition particle-docking protein FtsY [Afifella sp. JA880]MCT8268474.1 signal recognition particle-docking protein FtsY [Afifella sp. JA880]
MAKEKRGFFKRILFGEGNDIPEKEAERDETQLTDAEAAEESEARSARALPEEALPEEDRPEDKERLASHQLETENRGPQTTDTDIGIVEEAEAPDADLHRPAAAPADADAEAASFTEHPVKEPEAPAEDEEEPAARKPEAPEEPAEKEVPADNAASQETTTAEEPAEDTSAQDEERGLQPAAAASTPAPVETPAAEPEHETHPAAHQLETKDRGPQTTETDIGLAPEGEDTAEKHRPAAAETSADEEAGLAAAPVTETGEDVGEAETAEHEPAEEPAKSETLPVATELPRQNWLQRLRAGLSKSSSTITSRITGTFTKRRLDDETLEDLEDILIQADLGVATATAITERLARERYDKTVGEDEIRNILAEEVAKVLGPVTEPLAIDAAKKPFVILVVGVNGSGKTTTIGKLAAKLRAEGRSVMLAAGDTFRAAAIEQLKIWGERTKSTVISREQGADAAGLVFDAMQAAKKEGSDVLIIDTAGRLQNRAELMDELEKVVRVIKKHDPSAPHTTLLTLDATTGQNALSQVEIFGQRAGVTGLVMTKLDGTARGGILVAIAAKHALPVHFIGVGEGIDDLQPFKAEDFARAIAGM